MRLWLKYEKISLSKEALSSETSFSIRKALPLQNNNSLIDSQNVSKKALTFYPYYFFEYMFRGSVRSPPLLFEDRGYFVIDGVNSQLLKNFLTNELKDKPVTDYVLNTENKYTLELVKSKVEFHEARELALDHIIKRNTRQYTQEYGRNSYERLYVPKRYDVTFLKNYVAPVPIWNLELIDVDGLKHEKTVLGASGVVWKDMLYCPICKTKTGSNTIINCDQCGRVLCRNCIRESGFIFKKKLCPSCS